jgi:membrane dipeptidase
MEAMGEMKHITCLTELEQHFELWEENTNNELDHSINEVDSSNKIIDHTNKPIGYLLSLEGADSLITLDHLHIAYGYGLRAIGPGHYGPGRYANGTDSSGGLNEMGIALLREMQSLHMILDATHLCDDAFWDAMEIYDGTIWASHNNCRSIVNHNRQFSDEMIQTLIQKDAVIGGSLDAWMMVPGWQKGISTAKGMNCNLEKMVDHMDHICQLAGNSLHVGIGTDLDGAYGKEQCPYDIETIADMQTVPAILIKRGYQQTDIENILHNNWLRLMRKSLPV